MRGIGAFHFDRFLSLIANEEQMMDSSSMVPLRICLLYLSSLGLSLLEFFGQSRFIAVLDKVTLGVNQKHGRPSLDAVDG